VTRNNLLLSGIHLQAFPLRPGRARTLGARFNLQLNRTNVLLSMLVVASAEGTNRRANAAPLLYMSPRRSREERRTNVSGAP